MDGREVSGKVAVDNCYYKVVGKSFNMDCMTYGCLFCTSRLLFCPTKGITVLNIRREMESEWCV